MGNWYNRSKRRQIEYHLGKAIDLLREGETKAAESSLSRAGGILKEAPPNGGEVWGEVRDRYRDVLNMLERPCQCLFCTLSEDKQRKVVDFVCAKQEDLGTAYSDVDNNFTGAWAEVVFGFRYDLPINLVRGFDGGKDFTVPCVAVPS
jgi:hypothetical protein